MCIYWLFYGLPPFASRSHYGHLRTVSCAFFFFSFFVLLRVCQNYGTPSPVLPAYRVSRWADEQLIIIISHTRVCSLRKQLLICSSALWSTVDVSIRVHFLHVSFPHNPSSSVGDTTHFALIPGFLEEHTEAKNVPKIIFLFDFFGLFLVVLDENKNFP